MPSIISGPGRLKKTEEMQRLKLNDTSEESKDLNPHLQYRSSNHHVSMPLQLTHFPKLPRIPVYSWGER